MGLLAHPIAAGTGWDLSLVYGGLTVALLAGGATAGPVGRWTDRLGARPMLCVGSVMAAMGLAALASASSLAMELLARRYRHRAA
jgi:MFS family permease